MNSVNVIGGKVADLGLGFLFWLIAARTFPQEQVGLAAGVVSAMMLCTQFAIFGVGSALITPIRSTSAGHGGCSTTPSRSARSQRSSSRVGALVLAALSLKQLAVVSHSVAFAAFFLLAC